MMAGIHKRLAETHGTRFELLRHFLPRFFDSELLSSSGDWTRVAGGGLAILASSWMLLAYLLLFKYKTLAEMGLQERFASEARADLASLAGMAVCITAVLVAALWQSLYPTLRDYLSLAGFPVSSTDIFAAKFTALLAAFGLFTMVVTLPPAVVFCAVTGAGFSMSFATMVAACSVAFFSLIAVQGLLLNVLPGRIFERVMIWMQALLAAAGLGGFPLAAWRGHEILGDLNLPSRDLLLIALLPPLVAVAVYLLSFRRYRRLLLEAPLISPPRRGELLSRLLDYWFRDPREQAAFGYIWKTIQRSRTQRLAVLVYAGLAIGWVAKSAVDAMSGSPDNQELSRAILTAGPLALIVFTLLGLRHLFSLPAELRANWVFQITEREGRHAWMRAVEHFVLGCGIAPVVLIGAIFVFRADGWLVAAAWSTVAFFLAAIGFERLFTGWRKLPFTCSYLPGKRPLLVNLTLFGIAMMLLMPVAWMVYRCSTNPASFLVMLTAEIGVWAALRRSRMESWGTVPLRYEEQIEAEIDTFGFSGDGTVVAQEEFQREWNTYLRGDDVDPILRPLEAGETRIERMWGWLQAVPQDLKYALRLLIKKPGFALSVVVTLGLGLGLNAAFFTIFNAFLLRPLAVRDPASLVSISFETKYRTPVHLNWREYQLLAEGGRGLELAATSMEGTGFDGHPAKVAMVSGNFFSLLGAPIAFGRPFQAGETDAVMVLSYRTWQNRFASDEKIIGRRLLVNGVAFEVIGVAAPEFVGINVGTVAIAPKEITRYGVIVADLWVPIEVWNRTPGFPQYPVYGIVARLPADVSEQQTQQMMSGISRRMTENRERYNRIFRASVESLDIPITWTALEFSLPLLIAFGLTMLIPCANAANMMLARAMVRQRELGTRLSLGASRGRIVRQLLAESFVLAVLAAGTGIAVSRLALQLFMQTLYKTAPPTLLLRMRIPDLEVDRHVFVYMLIVAGLTTALFALAPAAQATRVAVAFALRGELGILRPSHLRDALVVTQVSACVMLLATAGVLLRGSGRSIKIDRGYETNGVYAAVNQSPEDAAALASLIDREGWAETRAVIGGLTSEMKSMLAGNPARPGFQNLNFMNASGSYFRLVRLPLLQGRAFTLEEGDSQAAVAVISELAAQKLWPGESPMGKTLSIEPGDQPNWRLPRFREATIIGVCRDVISKAKDGGPRPTIYFPEGLRRGNMLAVRGKGSADQTARQLESALARSPGAEHGARVVAMQEIVDWDTYPQQAASWLSSILGVVALLLTITGIYGVMSYLVSQRTKEIGIRMALGATPLLIARLVITYIARMAGVGLVFGAVLALGVLQYCASKVDLVIDLYDIPAYSWSLLAVIIAALLAALAPTRRACGVDPQEAVRTD